MTLVSHNVYVCVDFFHYTWMMSRSIVCDAHRHACVWWNSELKWILLFWRQSDEDSSVPLTTLLLVCLQWWRLHAAVVVGSNSAQVNKEKSWVFQTHFEALLPMQMGLFLNGMRIITDKMCLWSVSGTMIPWLPIVILGQRSISLHWTALFQDIPSPVVLTNCLTAVEGSNSSQTRKYSIAVHGKNVWYQIFDQVGSFKPYSLLHWADKNINFHIYPYTLSRYPLIPAISWYIRILDSEI